MNAITRQCFPFFVRLKLSQRVKFWHSLERIDTQDDLITDLSVEEVFRKTLFQ